MNWSRFPTLVANTHEPRRAWRKELPPKIDLVHPCLSERRVEFILEPCGVVGEVDGLHIERERDGGPIHFFSKRRDGVDVVSTFLAEPFPLGRQLSLGFALLT